MDEIRTIIMTTGAHTTALTLYVRGPSYLGLSRSISWLLMPWLLTSPGHQQPLYWLCRIGRSLSNSRRNFNYLCLINVEKCKYMFMFSLKNLARKWLTRSGSDISPNGASRMKMATSHHDFLDWSKKMCISFAVIFRIIYIYSLHLIFVVVRTEIL